MPRITVVATEHPVPLPNGRLVLPAAEEPEGMDVELDLFIRRRLSAGELRLLEPQPAPLPADPKPGKN